MATKPKASINVMQFESGQHSGVDPQRFRYRILSTTNTLEVSIGEVLTKPQVEDLIDRGVTVNVKAGH